MAKDNYTTCDMWAEIDTISYSLNDTKTKVDCNTSTACNAFMSGASNVKLH